jgi:hypothetical protein
MKGLARHGVSFLRGLLEEQETQEALAGLKRMLRLP